MQKLYYMVLHKYHTINSEMQYISSILESKLALPSDVENWTNLFCKKNHRFCNEKWTEIINMPFVLATVHQKIHIKFYSSMCTNLVLIFIVLFPFTVSPEHNIFVRIVWHNLSWKTWSFHVLQNRRCHVITTKYKFHHVFIYITLYEYRVNSRKKDPN